MTLTFCPTIIFAFKPVLWKNIILIGFTTVLIEEQTYLKFNVLCLYDVTYSLISSYPMLSASIITFSFRFLTRSYTYFLLSYMDFKV